MARLWRQIVLVSTLSVVALGLLAPPLAAKTAEPVLTARAWYWEEAESSEQTLPDGSKVTLETPNPFCPGIPGSLGAPEQTCAEGRLPIEIQNGDYETPNKISAVNFDLSLVPIGSKVSKFTVSFLEAKAGCYDTEDEGDEPNYCEQTDPVNIEGKELQACLINSFFGDGDARPYKEAPKHTCTGADPTAKRKETGKGDDVDHVWTFDLTDFAQEWIKEFTTNTSIMLVGKAPKGYKPGDSDSQDNWRVVLSGPKAPSGKQGVQAEITFDPADLVPPPTGTTTGTTTGTSTGTGTVSTTGSTGTVSSDTSSDFGSSDTVGGDTATTPTEAGDAAAPPVVAAGAEQTPEGIPGYVWLALLAGIIAWSVFRSVILENAKGIRPDGVLSQIQQLNSQRRGGPIAAAASEGPSAFSSVFGNIKSSAGSVLGKLKLTKKG